MAGAQAILAVTVTAAVLFGLIMTVLLSLKPAMRLRFGLTEDRFARLWAVLHLGVLPSLLASGMLIDRLGVRLVLALGSTLLVLGILLLIYRRAPSTIWIAVLLLGSGAACFCSASVVLMPHAFFGPDETTASFSFGLVFIALGALLAPALVEVLLRGLGWEKALGVLGALSLVPALLALLTRAPLHLPPDTEANLVKTISDPIIWTAGLIFFLYSPLEASVSTWFTTWLHDLGHDDRRALSLLSGFWSSFLVGRLVIAYLQHQRFLTPWWDTWILVGCALMVTVLLGNLASTVNPGHGAVGALLLGFFMGPIFPTLLGLVFEDYRSEQGTAFGAIIAFGSVGSVLLVPLIGSTLRRGTVDRVMRIPMLLGLGLTGMALVYGLAVQP